MLPPRPSHREFEARGLLQSPSGFGAEGADERQGRGLMPLAPQHAPLQPINRTFTFPSAAAVPAAYSQYQAPAEPAAPSYTAIPAPAHAISRLVEPDIEAQCCALAGSGHECSAAQEQDGTDAGGSTAANLCDHPTMLPMSLSQGQLAGATSASQLWQLDAQHSRSAVLEPGGDLLRDPAVSSQAVPASAQLPRSGIPEMSSEDASWQASGGATASEEGRTAAEVLQTTQAEQEPLRQQVSVWGNPLATVRMPQGMPVQAPASMPFPGQSTAVLLVQELYCVRQAAKLTVAAFYILGTLLS